MLNDLIKLINDKFDNLCRPTVEVYCRRYKLGLMTEFLRTRVYFTPKATAVSAYDKFAIMWLSKQLKDIPLGDCIHSKIQSQSKFNLCDQKSCRKEHEIFGGSVDQLIQKAISLPDSIVSHIQKQAQK